jgi:DivIVA domain-containing protein
VTEPLTADDVRRSTFLTTKFRTGYDQDEVDAFLDRVAATLDGLDTVRAAEVSGRTFSPVQWRTGYDPGQVDAFLARVADELQRRPRPATVTVPPTRTGGGLSAADVRQARFRTTTFSPGYDEDEVDAFFDRVAATLDGMDDLRAAEVTGRTFASVKWKTGYDRAQVDAFLVRVADELRRREPSGY